MTRVVLVGPPGAGKGTQAATLSQRLGVPHISTGDLFRKHVGEGTPLGREAKRYLDSGELVPDTVTNEMVRERLAEPDAQSGFLLDGFPRNTKQADVLGEILEENGHSLDAVIELKVPEDELVKRLLGRGRADDTEEVIRRRQQVYRSETAPLLEYYSDILVTVDGIGDVDEVSARVLDALGKRS
ncbi:adenylate kinase [Saccharomonospora viridis]|mgnify:CR=1 FL=1|jgi:adenylate kinase|uniref:Adenylate kinase n=1 Tax=Saccharomonospora viridis (strain ATCC 15386 / DSM 43017 / JCM 3036 / CCUG 5913 / NBRC 12207 / NCIMB 9602 / P101) TaxID=471857 RepID=C7MTW8_SACVD|nr:adenylate kinase [Saccharomonospora viridis]ACU95496.1 Adenylate kinase [Saccharomonospora viridis DSM 43017]SFP12699.1 Adenylate kinase [Saccharomonospora viridis]